MAATDVFARRATLSRSVRLLSEFRFEQTDPARFYTALAGDTAAMVADLWLATHRDPAACPTLLDVGGGPGYFATAFKNAGFAYIGVEPDPAEMHAGPATARLGHLRPRLGYGAAVRRRQRRHLPVVERRRACARAVAAGGEMLRVTKPGGLVVLSYTVWLGPFGGHEMGLTHYLGGARAADRYARKHGQPTEERLRIVVVRGIRGGRARMGGRHRRVGRRISPLPPTMGLVDEPGAPAEGIHGEQSGPGDAAAVNARTATGSRFASR